jgi:phenylacetate-CoA ligase
VAVTALAEPFDALDRLSPAELDVWWTRRLRRVLKAAGELPFYARRFNESGFDPAAFHGLEDLAGLPTFAKADVMAEQRRTGGHRVGIERVGSKAGRAITMSSGTSGTSFLTWPPLWRRIQGRSALRAHWWAGLRPGAPLVLAAPAWHAYAVVQTYIAEELELPTVMVAGTYLPRFADRIVDCILAFRPRFVIIFLPMLFSLLAEAPRRGLPAHELFASVERINAVGAPLTPALQRHLEQRAGVGTLVEMAGTSENVLAVECGRHAGLHVVPDTCYVEVLDRHTGTAVGPGQRGTVVHCTTVPWGSIYLRHDTGDAATLDREPCGCGLPSPRMKMVGRWEDAFSLAGREHLPYDVQQAVEEEVPELVGTPCAVVREGLAAGRLELLVERPPSGRTSVLGAAVTGALRRRFQVDVEVQWAEELPLLFKGVTPVVSRHGGPGVA